MRRPVVPIILLLLVVGGLAACGAAEPAGARWQAAAAPASPTAKPAPPPPRPAPKNKEEAGRQARLALADLSTFRQETAEHTSENSDDWRLRSLCRDILPSDRLASAGRERRWVKSPIWIRQHVVGYLTVPGRKLIGELRTVLQTCRSYRTGEGRTATIVPWSPAGVPANPDVVTFCERQQTDDGPLSQCTIMMARGSYVLNLDASDGDGDLKKSQAMVAKLYPLVTEAFVKAT
ncbi:hypothetical protein [Micromonospora sp. NPDC005087]|uniref:hypothetical protein n=1 Tax=Micromonospora sp. NPDC005087 TaxID=3364225 RepID=UPI00368A38BA